jgi:hypothetical protein
VPTTDEIRITIESLFAAQGATAATAAFQGVGAAAGAMVAELRAAAAAAGSSEPEFLAAAGALSQMALAAGDAAGAEAILASAMAPVASEATAQAAAVEADTASLGAMEVATQGATAAMGALGIAFGAMMAVKIGVDLAETGAAALRTEAAFNNLSAASGTTGTTLLTTMRAASGGEISDMNLELEASKAQFLGVAHSASDFSQLLAIARNNAQQMGMSTEEAYAKLIDGLDKGTPRLLKQVGLNIDIKTANDAYATSIGKTVGQLDAEEKKQALVAAVMQQGAAQIRATGGAMETTAGQIEQGKAGFENLKTSVGELAAIRLGPLAADVGKVANALSGSGGIMSGISGMADLAGKFNPVVNIVHSLTSAMDSATVSIGHLVGIQIPDTFSPLRDSVNQWLNILGLAPAAEAGVTAATGTMSGAFDEDRSAIGANQAALQTHTAVLSDDRAEAVQDALASGMLSEATQKASDASMIDTAAKAEQAAKTALLAGVTEAAAAAFMALHPNISASGVAALAAAGQITPVIAQMVEARIRADEWAAALARVNAMSGINTAYANAGQAGGQQRLDRMELDSFKQSGIEQDAERDRQAGREAAAAERSQVLQTGSSAAKLAILRKEYDDAARLHGAGSALAINAQTAVMKEEEKGAKARAGGAAAAAGQITSIEEKTGDKIAKIVEDTQKKITAIDEREAAKQAAALRKLNEDIATMTADRRASNEADDLDLVGVKDAKEAAKLNDRERAEADSRKREQSAQDEARAQANAGDAESAQKTLAIRETQINAQQSLDEKYYAKQRELAGDPANTAALKTQYDEATRANEEAAQARLDITKQEADQKKAAVQAEKDAVVAAAEEQANQVGAAAERGMGRVKKATDDAKAKGVADLHAIGDAVNAIPSSKTITITVNQSGNVSAGSAGGGGSSGNKAAGGGAFLTHGQTSITVGDNPGGQELVMVAPISGKGTSSASGNMVQLAGGGAVVIDAGSGYTTPIAGAPVAAGKAVKGKGGSGANAPAADPKKALDEMKNTVALLMDMAKLKEEIASLAGVPAFDVPMVQALIARAQEFTTAVEQHLVPLTKNEGDALARYLGAAKEAASLLKDMADLKKAIAELKDVPAFDQPMVLALINRAQQFTIAMQQHLIPLTEFEATQMARYRAAVGDTVGILKDVADLKKTLAEAGSASLRDDTIIRLAEDAARVETIVNQRLVPATKDQADKLGLYRDTVGSSVSILKDVMSLTGKMFSEYVSPSDAQISTLANDAKRVADGVMQAASTYDKDGLAAGKAYAEAIGATFTAFKDGLLFFAALQSGDF